MNRTHCFFFLAATTIAITAGCAGKKEAVRAAEPAALPPVEVAKGNEAALFPMKKGNEWVYDYESSIAVRGGRPKSERSEMVWRIVDVEPIAGGERATLDILIDKKKIDTQRWQRDAKGLHQMSAGKVLFDPPKMIIPFPVEKDGKHDWKGRGMLPVSLPGTSTQKVEVLGPQEVDTVDGRAPALAVQSVTDFEVKKEKGRSVSVGWYQPNVGIVRYRTEVILGNIRNAQLMRLKSTNVKP